MTVVPDFLQFNDACPTAFHTAAVVRDTLVASGFRVIREDEPWPTGPGKFVVVRSGSLIAWIEPPQCKASDGFRILGAHTDSPHLRIKQHHDISGAGVGVLALEPYGSPILASWFDRDLGVAGRIVLDDLSERLVTLREPIVRVPNLAIHLDRDKEPPNPQRHLNGLWSAEEASFIHFLAEQQSLDPDTIVGFELVLFDAYGATKLGSDHSFISAPRLDNLGTVWAALVALLTSSGSRRSVVGFFDHEEVGSESERGAGSPFLTSTLERIVLAAGGDRESVHRSFAQSILVSGDMAHGTHPNFPEKHEPLHRIHLGGGPVLKINTNLRYASDARGAAFFAAACEHAGVPLQRFMSRADIPCGSTIGPIAAAATGILTVDVGAPQLAMHSVRELMLESDLDSYSQALASCFEIEGFSGGN